MQIQVHDLKSSRSTRYKGPSGWLHNVIALLDAAISQLDQEQAAHSKIRAATSLLRKQAEAPPIPDDLAQSKEQLLGWEKKKVIDYIDGCINSRILVSDLCALVQRSEAHFSRCFRHTFGDTPHAFVIRRRVALAARYMLRTDAALSEIALQCGFVDQAHLCKHFRGVTGETPAAWRRARRVQESYSSPIDSARETA